jgi:hypothetical protein
MSFANMRFARLDISHSAFCQQPGLPVPLQLGRFPNRRFPAPLQQLGSLIEYQIILKIWDDV